jgi:regulator of RNase E activity RraA
VTVSSVTTAVLGRLARLDTAGLTDADKGLRLLAPALRPVVPGARLLGRAVTADARDDLVSVLAVIQQAGPGDVVVIAGGGAERALLGELFASEIERRGAAGVVVDGLCRDSAHLASMQLPVFCRGFTARAAGAALAPVAQVPVSIAGVEVRPGEIVLGDDDGIVVASVDEMLAALDAAEAIQAREGALRQAIEAGNSLFEHLNFAEHVAALAAGEDTALAFA